MAAEAVRSPEKRTWAAITATYLSANSRGAAFFTHRRCYADCYTGRDKR
jgi:hypothetical protein